jgi:hypothetical protein
LVLLSWQENSIAAGGFRTGIFATG